MYAAISGGDGRQDAGGESAPLTRGMENVPALASAPCLQLTACGASLVFRSAAPAQPTIQSRPVIKNDWGTDLPAETRPPPPPPPGQVLMDAAEDSADTAPGAREAAPGGSADMPPQTIATEVAATATPPSASAAIADAISSVEAAPTDESVAVNADALVRQEESFRALSGDHRRRSEADDLKQRQRLYDDMIFRGVGVSVSRPEKPRTQRVWGSSPAVISPAQAKDNEHVPHGHGESQAGDLIQQQGLPRWVPTDSTDEHALPDAMAASDGDGPQSTVSLVDLIKVAALPPLILSASGDERRAPDDGVCGPALSVAQFLAMH
jgi:hypothetical protein